MSIDEYWKEMTVFMREKCAGPEYDSCHDSPCRFSSPSGCSNPEHPIHKFRAEQAEAPK